jgi:glycosidase
VFETRKDKQIAILSSHGEASRYFVTFCDNHDENQRFYCPKSGQQDDRQVALALASLFGIQGIPCVYYSTETSGSTRL